MLNVNMLCNHHAPPRVKTSTLNPSSTGTSCQQLWGLWEWDGNFGDGKLTQSLVYGTNETLLGFAEVKAALKTEIERIHAQVGEDACAFENFQTGPIGTVGDHVLFDFPDEATPPDSFDVMISQNGTDIKYGIVAWKAGKQPDHPPENT
jgi:hypothetical protein